MTNKLCMNYRLIKENFEVEHYLKIQEFSIRNPLIKYRTGSHALPISDQRYLDIDVRNTCPLCDTHDVGDEYHYVMTCPALNELRLKYLPPYYRTRPNTLKYKELFGTKNKRKLINLSKFVREIMFIFRP